MNRVEQAIQEGRCVLAIGGRALQDPQIVMELRRRTALPFLALGAPAVAPVQPVNAESLAPVLARAGGLLVLVEPEATQDAGVLKELAAIIQKAANKPRLCIAAKTVNPFTLPEALRLLKLEHEKLRARDFLASLPATLAQVAVTEPEPKEKEKEKEKKKDRAPEASFVGRVEESAELSRLLESGGPIALVGPSGAGKRWLVEKVLSESKFRRVPDLFLAWGTETDALMARLCALLSVVGDDRLKEAHLNPEKRPAPAALADLVVDCLQNTALEDVVWVIHGLDQFLREDGTFHRNGRLQTLLSALLSRSYSPRILFPLSFSPVFYREGAGSGLRTMRLEGLKGRELHQVFESYRVENIQRDKMGEIWNQVWGHPVATRAWAVAVRDSDDPDKIYSNPKFLKMEHVGDLEPLRRRIRRQVERLEPDLKAAILRMANVRLPEEPAGLQGLEIGRNERLLLQARGLVETLPCANDRRIYVHPLVRDLFTRKETTEIAVQEKLAEHYTNLFQKASGQERLALGQEANRCSVLARKPQAMIRVGYPDQDMLIESCRGMIRGQKGPTGLAEERLNRVLKADPAHTEGLLLKAELLVEKGDSPEAIAAVYRKAAEVAPTPELFHHEATWLLERQKRPDRAAAVEALERGVAIFPDNGRLMRRLAGLLRQEGRVDDAMAVLQKAMEVEPMMPDTYGLMGDILVERGMAHWPKARQLLDEALRLSPEDPIHLTRLGRLERLQGLVEMGQRAELWQSAAARFDQATRSTRNTTQAMLELATLLLDQSETPDLDRCTWLVKEAEALRDNGEQLHLKARIQARMGRKKEAEDLLRRLLKRDPKHHVARAALGEVLTMRGRIFEAYNAYQQAQQDAPQDSPERLWYEVFLARLRILIESGEAVEILKRAEEEEARSTEPEPQAPQPRTPKERVTRRGRGQAPRAATADTDSERGETESPADGASPEEAPAEDGPATEEAPATSEEPVEPAE